MSDHAHKGSGPSIHRSQSCFWEVIFAAFVRASRLQSRQIHTGIMTRQPTVRVPTQMGKRVKNVAISHMVRSGRLAANKAASKITKGNIQSVKNAATRMKSQNLSGRSCLVVEIGGPECFMGWLPDHNAGVNFSVHSRNRQTQAAQRSMGIGQSAHSTQSNRSPLGPVTWISPKRPMPFVSSSSSIGFPEQQTSGQQS